MKATITGTGGASLPITILETHTRTIFRDCTWGECHIRLATYGAQSEQPVAAPATYDLAIGGQGPLTLHVAVCLELPAGGYFVSGEVVARCAACEAAVGKGSDGSPHACEESARARAAGFTLACEATNRTGYAT